MKDSKLLLILLPIAAILFWYFGRPPSTETVPVMPVFKPLAVQPANSPTSASPSVPASSLPNLLPEATPASSTPAASNIGGQTRPASGDIDLPAPASLPVTGNPDIAPDQKLEALRYTFRTYASRHKGNPVGGNAEITAVLLGKNTGTANYLADGTHGLNEKGELCDGWGTPYFFHQLSGTEMEIRSAGPDQKMYTSDDLVTK